VVFSQLICKGRLFLTLALVFLIISEIPLFRTYFLTHWPLLSPIHGFVTLGLAMLGIGANILGNLNKASASKEALGLNIWRSVVASGIVVFALGWVNILVVSFHATHLSSWYAKADTHP